MVVPDVLAFADKKTDGAYDVTEPSGTIVARIKVAFWSGSSFEATTASGEPLCTGRHVGILSWTWRAVGADGAELASLRTTFWGNKKAVLLPGRRMLSLEGRLFSRDWALRDAEGRDVLTSVPSTGAWSFRPDAWVVRSHDTSLSLAQVVGIVQLNRLMVKGGRSAAAASA